MNVSQKWYETGIKKTFGTFLLFPVRRKAPQRRVYRNRSKISGGGNLQLSKYVKIMPQAMLVSLGKGRIEINERSEVSMYSRIASVGYVKIGRNVLMGPNVFIADYNHEYRNPNKAVMFQGNRYVPNEKGLPDLLIDDDTWIGTNAVIVGNVRIGKHCVIGANTVVNCDIPDYSVVVGSPCKIVKRYDFEKGEWIKEQ